MGFFFLKFFISAPIGKKISSNIITPLLIVYKVERIMILSAVMHSHEKCKLMYWPLKNPCCNLLDKAMWHCKAHLFHC